MDQYVMYNSDQPVAEFSVDRGTVCAYHPSAPELLPMQIRSSGPEGLMLWLQARAVDLNTFLHRELLSELWGTRDKLTLILLTHMFSISDTFTCFRKGEFLARNRICSPDEQSRVSRYILVSGDTSVRGLRIATPNASTDGSFPKTWEYEDGEWWLYKLQPAIATRCEVEIYKTLHKCGWDAAEYRYTGTGRTRVKSRCFLAEDEFFEPYDSFRYAFTDRSDDDPVILQNISSLGAEYETAWKRILLADAFFMNTDRHMRNFGVIRSSVTGKPLRLAPNFDNNQAYTANPRGVYSDAMLKACFADAGQDLLADLAVLTEAARKSRFLQSAVEAAERLL